MKGLGPQVAACLLPGLKSTTARRMRVDRADDILQWSVRQVLFRLLFVPLPWEFALLRRQLTAADGLLEFANPLSQAASKFR